MGVDPYQGSSLAPGRADADDAEYSTRQTKYKCMTSSVTPGGEECSFTLGLLIEGEEL